MASENVGTNLIAGGSIYSTITESDARLGGAVDLSYLSGDVEKVKLIYEVGEDYISNDGSEYAENCLDLQGIKRYNIFRYFEDVNMLLPVATEFDVENNTLYAETDELGTYCVLDMEMLLQNLGIAPDGMQTAAVEKKLYSGIGTGYNVTFIIDTRKDFITEDELQRVKDELCTFMAHSLSNGYNLGITLYTQNSTNFADECCEYVGNYKTTEALEAALDGISLTDRYGEEYVGYTYCEITEGIEKASVGSQGTNDYVFSVFAQDGTLFDVEKYNQIYKNVSMTGVNISFITDKYGLNTAQTRLPDITSGIVVNNISTFADNVYNHIFEEPLVEVETFSAILATGYQQVELKGVLNAYNGYDTDEDTLTDWREVDVEHWLEVGLITYNDDNTIKLPTVEQCMKFTEISYVESALDRLQSDYGANFGAAIANKPVMPISSDPTNIDGDFDGIDDVDDDMRLNNHFIGTLIDTAGAKYDVRYEVSEAGNTNNDEVCVSVSDAKYYPIEYVMDYSVFFKDNSTYSSSLCTISSLYATTAYMNMSIDDEFYAYNHPDSYYAAALMEKHGMSNIEVVEIVGDGTDQHVTDIIIGSRQISKNGQFKTVILVAIRGTGDSALREGSNVMEWSSNFDIGCDSIYANDGNSIIPKNPDWIIEENHMGFDIAATRVIAAINQYINDNNIDVNNSVIWLTGHSRGAGISNVVGARVGNKAIESENDYNNEYICESFVYTFASPRTTVVDASIAKSYDYIFNIVNEDDIVTELPFKQWGFIRYGEDISISILNKYKSQWNSLANEQDKYNTDIEWRKNLVDEMALLSNNERNGCYKYTCECEHGDKTDDSITMGLGLFKDEIAYAKPYRTVTEGEHVCETVAYFMQFLSYLAANGSDNITIIFTDVSPKYESVKSSFIRYYICKNMKTPHHQLSYFLLSRCL